MTKQIGQPKPSLQAMDEDDASASFLHMMAMGEAFLEHHGVKGMRWGVRRAINARNAHMDKSTQKRAASIQRVASGKGSVRDKAYSTASATPFSLARNKGSIKKEAQQRSDAINARQARLKNHTATKFDKAKKWDTTGMSNVAPLQSMKGKKTAEKDKLKINASDHAVTKQAKKDHNNLDNYQFVAKYGVAKKNYRKRVAKTGGDPYQHALNKKAKLVKTGIGINGR